MSRTSRSKPKRTDPAWSSVLPKREEIHRLKRRAILQTAAELINEAGFHGASVDELARRLNITKPTLYHYIPSKDDIALQLLDLNFSATSKALEAAENHRGTGLDRLRHFAREYAELMATPEGAAAVQIAMLPHSRKVRTHRDKLFRQVDVSARSFIVEGIEDGSIRQCDARWVDFLLFGGLHWMTRWFRSDRQQSAADVAGSLFDLIEFGIASRVDSTD
ncbi:MAG: TetR/AcrR family transcriptional regulator [Proteobacteria bacterium]|nr:TetR/AcrR family transcriptional regulator [Pseudomonadota bacterium]